MSKINIKQISSDEICVSIANDIPMEMVNSLTKNLISKGMVEDLSKSTVGERFFFRPENKSSDLADKLIKSLEGMVKDDEPYWSTKSKFQNQAKNRAMDMASRSASTGTASTSVTPAPVASTTPTKMYDTTTAAMRTAEGSGKRYGFVKAEHKEGDKTCKCETCEAKKPANIIKKRQAEMQKSWAKHLPFPNAEEEMSKLAKGTKHTGEEASADQLANLMANKSMLGEYKLPGQVKAMFAAPPPQPTDQQMFGHLAVTEEMAKSAEQRWNGTFNNWLTEANKPISQRFKSEAEELAYWKNLKVDGSSSGDDSGF